MSLSLPEPGAGERAGTGRAGGERLAGTRLAAGAGEHRGTGPPDALPLQSEGLAPPGRGC